MFGFDWRVDWSFHSFKQNMCFNSCTATQDCRGWKFIIQYLASNIAQSVVPPYCSHTINSYRLTRTFHVSNLCRWLRKTDSPYYGINNKLHRAGCKNHRNTRKKNLRIRDGKERTYIFRFQEEDWWAVVDRLSFGKKKQSIHCKRKGSH